MPYISTKVSLPISKEAEAELSKKYGEIITLIPGKTERWLMLSFEDNARLWFAGKNDAPIAYVELKLLGTTTDAVYDKLTAAICEALSESLGISPENIYVKYEEADRWGWNNGNF